MSAAGLLLMLAAWALAADAPKKPWKPPKLQKGFSAADLPSGSTTTARADAFGKPSTVKPKALPRAQAPDVEPGQIKVPLTPYVWEPDAKIEKAPAPEPKPKPKEPEKEVWVTIPEMKVYEEPPKKPLVISQPLPASQ